MNGLGKKFRKKSDPENRKKVQNKSQIAACEQITTLVMPFQRVMPFLIISPFDLEHIRVNLQNEI